MARNQIADRTRSRKGPKMADNSQRKSENSSKENANKEKDEPEVMIIPSSSSDSQNGAEEEEVAMEEVVEVDEGDDEEPDNKKDENTKEYQNQNQKEIESALYSFPMHRISRMIKSQDPDIRISQEAVFLINKASEKFLHLFCMEAFACSFLDHMNSVDYKHLSSVICKRRRFDFLSDFVPEKVKAEDALKEVPSAET